MPRHQVVNTQVATQMSWVCDEGFDIVEQVDGYCFQVIVAQFLIMFDYHIRVRL